MKESVYKSYDELPLFLCADHVANLLGISISSAYELMQQNDFPVLRIGNRKINRLIHLNSHLIKINNS